MKKFLIFLGIIIYVGWPKSVAAALVNKVSVMAQGGSTNGKITYRNYVALDKNRDPYPYYTILHLGGVRPQNSVIPQLFNDRHNRLQLSIHEAGSGLGFSHQQNRVETMGARNFSTYMRMVSPNYPTTFFINYMNETNYQALVCQNWKCTYKHKKNGRFIEELEQTMELLDFQNKPLTDYEFLSWSFIQYMTRVRIILGRDFLGAVDGATHNGGRMVNQMNIDFTAEEALPMWGEYRIEEYLSAGEENTSVAGNQYIRTIPMAKHWTDDHLINRYYRQTDPDWANEKLGHSQKLTIGSDGCALTSALMLLEYYGHHTNFEKNKDWDPWEKTYDRQINPALFNEWLKKQPDGFNEGVYLNWAAVARFTRESHEYYYAQGQNLPKLEFVPVTGESEAEIKAEIDEDLLKRQPVLLNIGGSFGHFNVAVNNHSDEPYDIFGEGDLVLADPYYSGLRSWQQIKKKGGHTLLGARRFVPSFTDLSYIWMYSFSDQLQVKLRNSTGEEKILEPWADEISSPTTNEGMKKLYRYTLAKPATDKWEIEIVNATENKADISAIIYNSGAKVLEIEEDIEVEGGMAKKFELDFQKDEEPGDKQMTRLIQEGDNEEMGVKKFKAVLERALAQKKIRFYAYRTLWPLVERIEEENEQGNIEAAQRYLMRVKWWLDYYTRQPKMADAWPLAHPEEYLWKHMEEEVLILLKREVARFSANV